MAFAEHEQPESIQRAAHGLAAALKDVRVDHGGLDVFVAQPLLDGADIVVILQQVRGEAMPEGVARHALFKAGGTGGGADGFLLAALVQVMAPYLPAARA